MCEGCSDRSLFTGQNFIMLQIAFALPASTIVGASLAAGPTQGEASIVELAANNKVTRHAHISKHFFTVAMALPPSG